MSELGIHYAPSAFLVEKIQGADKKFLKAPGVGHRAPDAPLVDTTLFELYKQKPFNILFFNVTAVVLNLDKVLALTAKYPELIAIHQFTYSQPLNILFDRYGISQGEYILLDRTAILDFAPLGRIEILY